MIVLESLKVRNFFAIKEAAVEFKTGLTLIEGENRDSDCSSSNFSGKSSLLESIIWCWYGKTLRDVPADDVIKKGSDGCLVESSFLSGESSYKIVRSRTIAVKSVPSVQIFCNEENITPAKSPQDLIDTILGIPYNVFVFCCVFAQGSKFHFIDLPNSEQKKILEGLISFEGFGVIKQAVVEEHKRLKEFIQKLKDSKLKLNTRHEELIGEEGRLKTWLDEYKTPTNFDAKLKMLGFDGIPELRASIAKYKVEIEKLNDEIDKLIDRKEIQTKKKEASLRVKTVLDTEIAGLEKKRAVLLGLSKSPTCPTCYQKVSVEHAKSLVEPIEKELKEKRLDLLTRSKAIKKLSDDLEELTRLKKEAWAKREAFRDVLSQETELASQAAERHDISKLTKRLEEVTQELTKVTEDIEDADSKLDKASKLEEYYIFVEEAFSISGIESFLLDQALPYLNKQANYYANILSDGRITIKCSTIKATKKGDFKDTFNVQVYVSDGGDSYGACSGSEGRFADLAIAFAKRDLAEASGLKLPPILLLDEIADTIDSIGLKRMLDFLHNYSKDKTVWLITHAPEMREYYDHHILVVKEHGEARV